MIFEPSLRRERVYIYDRMYQIYLGNCIFIHVYIYIHTQSLDVLFYHFHLMPLFLFQIASPYFCNHYVQWTWTISKFSSKNFASENQDRKRRQSVDALQEPIEEPTTSRHNGGWHRIEAYICKSSRMGEIASHRQSAIYGCNQTILQTICGKFFLKTNAHLK